VPDAQSRAGFAAARPRPSPQEGSMANVSVNFDQLTSNHPSYQRIRSLLKGIPAYVGETCTVQLSYALNRSDGAIGNYAYPDATLATGKVRAFRGSDGLTYVFAVPDMKVYLNNAYDDAENYKGSQQRMIERIKDRPGILAFGHRHIDLWTGKNIHRPADYDVPYLWTNDSVQLRGIFFWEVTSKWGF
jgi:Type VI secretion system (T6SS), amidase effector protein 4